MRKRYKDTCQSNFKCTPLLPMIEKKCDGEPISPGHKALDLLCPPTALNYGVRSTTATSVGSIGLPFINICLFDSRIMCACAA